MKPNFIIIGAARSGTTSLHKYLDSHPEIFLSEIKELNFFSNPKYWSKGWDWYERQFQGAYDKIVGEASTSYTSYPIIPNVPQRIYEYIPNVKLIYILRDPIERLKSHYLHNINRGSENRQFSDLINNYQEEPLYWQGMYCLQIEQFLKYFSMQNLLLLLNEDLKNRPQQTLHAVCDFLGVQPNFPSADCSSHHNSNKTVTQKNKLGQKVLRFYHRNLEQTRLPYKFKSIFFNLAEVGAKQVESPILSADDYHKLQKLYASDVKRLNHVYGLNTRIWKNFAL